MSVPVADFIFRTVAGGLTGVLYLLTNLRSFLGLRSRLRSPSADEIKGLLEIDTVDAHAQNLYRRQLLLVRRSHFLAAASSSTASVSLAAFCQEKRLTFS